MQLSAKRALAWASAALAFVSFARVVVLFLEALSEVRDERAQDHELLQLCREGSARGSMKMRTACLQAHADSSSPVLLKAVLRAVSTAWMDFSDAISSPAKLAIVVLFVVSSLFLPVSTWMRVMMPTAPLVEGRSHVVVLADDAAAALGRPRIGLKRQLSRALRLRRSRSGDRDHAGIETPLITEINPNGDDEEQCFMTVSLDHFKSE